MSIPLPSDVLYHEVTWTLAHAQKGRTTLDGARGRVTFEATAAGIAYDTLSILPAPVVTPVIAGAMTPVSLLESEPGVWNWKVTPSVGVHWPPFYIDVTGPTDVAATATAPGSGPVRVVKGERGAQGASLTDLSQADPETLVATIEDPLTGDSTTETFTLPRGPEGPVGGTEVVDPQVASWVEDRESTTAAAIRSTATAYDVPAAAAAAANAVPAFVAAATRATAEGRSALRVAPGTYTVPGIHPDDIHGMYVVGDGVRLVGSPIPNLFPFTTDEWIGGASRATGGVVGRGVVAFELDDAAPSHWSSLFPVCKELGITMGTAWHTANGARWVKEAHRHGWEVMSHMPHNADWSAVPLEEVEAAAVESLDKIEAEIGTREGIGFVYPQHLRTDETDRILSKYYTRGRGLAGKLPYTRGGSHPWLTTAYAADPHLNGTVSEDLKAYLRSVAAQDGQVVLYMHHDSSTASARESALRELVPFIRSLGMDIRNPGQVWGGTNILPDTYNDKSSWVATGTASIATVDRYHGGPSGRIATGIGSIQVGEGAVTPRSGMFTVARLSARFKTAGFTVSSDRFGVGPAIAERPRRIDGGTASGSQAIIGYTLPAGDTQGAANWSAYRRLIYLQPSTIGAWVALNGANITSGELLVDEVRLDLVDYVPSVEVVLTLSGTTTVETITGIPNLGRCGVAIQPLGPVAGSVSYSVSQSTLRVVSTSASDSAQVKAIITPGPPYESMTVPTTGA